MNRNSWTFLISVTIDRTMSREPVNERFHAATLGRFIAAKITARKLGRSVCYFARKPSPDARLYLTTKRKQNVYRSFCGGRNVRVTEFWLFRDFLEVLGCLELEIYS